MTAASPFGGFRLGGDRKPSLYNIGMKKTSEVLGHPLWMMPVILLSLVAMIEGMHTAAHMRMKIDANAYCRNNAEWIEMNEQ